MYQLFTNSNIISTTIQSNNIKFENVNFDQFFLEDYMEVVLNVPKIINPQIWLIKPFSCIVLYRLKSYEDESLELIINSPVRTGKYYVLGEDNIVIISSTNGNDTFILNRETISMLLERSTYCNKPLMISVNNISNFCN